MNYALLKFLDVNTCRMNVFVSKWCKDGKNVIENQLFYTICLNVRFWHNQMSIFISFFLSFSFTLLFFFSFFLEEGGGSELGVHNNSDEFNLLYQSYCDISFSS